MNTQLPKEIVDKIEKDAVKFSSQFKNSDHRGASNLGYREAALHYSQVIEQLQKKYDECDADSRDLDEQVIELKKFIHDTGIEKQNMKRILNKAVIAINNMDDLYLHSDLFKQRAKELFSVGDEINNIINHPQAKTEALPQQNIFQSEIEGLKAENERLNKSINEAIKVISKLQSQIKGLEADVKKNYDLLLEMGADCQLKETQIKGLVEVIERIAGEIKTDEYPPKVILAAINILCKQALTNYYNSTK